MADKITQMGKRRSIDTGTATLLATLDGHAAWVRFNRPERLNALNSELEAGLERVLPLLHEDEDVRVVVVTGSGRAFCAGSDVLAMHRRPFRPELPDVERSKARAAERARLEWAFENVVRLYELPKPTIAALHGPVAGAGLALALSCDFRIAARDVRMVAAYNRLALPGDWGLTALLPELAGMATANLMLLRGVELSGDEALRRGLVDELVDDHIEESHRLASQFAAKPVNSLGDSKRLLRRLDLRSTISREIEATLDCQELPEHGKAVAAFSVKSRRNREPSKGNS